MFCKKGSDPFDPLKTYENNDIFKNVLYCLKIIKKYGLFDKDHLADLILPDIASTNTKYHSKCHKRYTNIQIYKKKFASEDGGQLQAKATEHEDEYTNDETLRARSNNENQFAANQEVSDSLIENMEDEDDYDSDEDSDYDPENAHLHKIACKLRKKLTMFCQITFLTSAILNQPLCRSWKKKFQRRIRR